MPAAPKIAEADEVLKHSAFGVAFSSGMAAWMPPSTPSRLTLTIRSMVSHGCSSK